MPSLTNLQQFVAAAAPRNGDIPKGLTDLRYALLVDGIPPSQSDLRIYIWLILLAAPPVPTKTYLDLVHQGPSPSYGKIRNDTFRTMTTDPLFRRRVTENSLTRVLNAVAWKLHDAHESRVNGWQSPPSIGFKPPLSFSGSPESKHESPVGARAAADVMSDAGTSTAGAAQDQPASTIGYVQGMNVLAAPFLYVSRSEVQAFAAFNTLITSSCPGYVRGGSMEGVHRGLALVDKILSIVDGKLFAHLMAKGLKAEIYAFASVLTLSACTPPLLEVLNLWDFLLAYGPHLNLFCIVAQLVLIRDDILASPSPNQILRQFPPLQSGKIKAMAISFVRMVPNELYEEIVNHAA